MNTVKKGNDFEDKAFEIISNLISQNTFGFSELVKVFRKKPYRSEERGGDIIFDLAIEVWAPKSENFSFLYLIECKDFDKPIPVEKMGYFIGNVKQVRAHKGVFISTKGFQSGAVNLAKFNRVMLIRAEMNGGYEIELHKRNINKTNWPLILSPEERTIDTGTQLIVDIIDKVISEAFKLSVEPKPLVDDQIKHRSKDEINKITRIIAEEINPKVRTDADGITLEMLKEYINYLGLKIEEIDDRTDVLGYYKPRQKIIGIRKNLPEKRKLFVIAHELGHFILHSNIAISQEQYENFSDPEINIKTNKFLLSNPKNEIEWQANYFAASLILPDYAIIARLGWYQQQHGISKGVLYMDDQPSNMRAFVMIIEKLANNFHTTKTSVQYRLMELNKLKNGSRLKGIGQIIADNSKQIFR